MIKFLTDNLMTPEKIELNAIKLLSDAGALSEAVMLRTDMQGMSKWILCFKGSKAAYILCAQRGGARIFKTIDAAYKQLVELEIDNNAIRIDRQVPGFWDAFLSEFIKGGEK